MKSRLAKLINYIWGFIVANIRAFKNFIRIVMEKARELFEVIKDLSSAAKELLHEIKQEFKESVSEKYKKFCNRISGKYKIMNGKVRIGTKVDVYYNLHQGCLSIRSRESKNRGRVIGYSPACIIDNAEFIVQPRGRQRVLRERQKNVHAFVRGNIRKDIKRFRERDLFNFFDKFKPERVVMVKYNPFRNRSFIQMHNKKKISRAECVVVHNKKIWAINPDSK